LSTQSILIVYSWDDYISHNRWNIISASPLTQGFIVRQCFALAHEMAQTSPEDLATRLCAAVTEQTPDILLTHTGVAFRRQPDVFIAALRKVKEAFPSLRMGFEHKMGMSSIRQESGLFEDSEDMHEIETLFFERVFGERRR
jgi:hypothetical protein